jgi:ankyrin repeat protein
MPGRRAVHPFSFQIRSGEPLGAVDRDGRTALHYAAAKGHTDVVELLLKSNAAVNAQDTAG